MSGKGLGILNRIERTFSQNFAEGDGKGERLPKSVLLSSI